MVLDTISQGDAVLHTKRYLDIIKSIICMKGKFLGYYNSFESRFNHKSSQLNYIWHLFTRCRVKMIQNIQYNFTEICSVIVWKMSWYPLHFSLAAYIGSGCLYRKSEEYVYGKIMESTTAGMTCFPLKQSQRLNRQCQDYVYLKWEYWSTM